MIFAVSILINQVSFLVSRCIPHYRWHQNPWEDATFLFRGCPVLHMIF